MTTPKALRQVTMVEAVRDGMVAVMMPQESFNGLRRKMSERNQERAAIVRSLSKASRRRRAR